MDIQDELQTLYTSGTVFHAFLGEKLPDWEAAAKLVRTIAKNYKLPYYSLSPTYSICKTHGYLAGEQWNCPHCGAKAEVYSRITGYYRPVQNWNEGKSQEYKNRKLYDLAQSRTMADPLNTATNRITLDTEMHTQMEEISAPEKKGDGIYLFTTKTCPNCKLAKEFLKDVSYEIVDAEENIAMADTYGIMQAPTLVVVNNGEVTKYVNASNIKGYVQGLGK